MVSKMTEAVRLEGTPDDYRAGIEAALDAADIGLWLWDFSTDNVTSDAHTNAMFGVPPSPTGDTPAREYLRAIHPDDLASVTGAVNKVIAVGGGERYDEQYRVNVAGRERKVAARGIVKRDPNGVALELSGIVVDISQHQELDADRSQLPGNAATQMRIFDTTLSSIRDFAYIFDREGRFLYANKALLDLWELPLDQIVGKNFFDLQYPADLASRLQQQIQQVIDTRAIVMDETPYTSRTGAGGYYEYIFTPVFAADGSVEVVAGSTRDLSAHKRTETALRGRTAQFESLLNDAPLGVYLVDADLRVREVNPQARPVFGDIPDLIGRDFEEVMHVLWPKEFADEIVKLFRHTLATGEPYITSERIEQRLDLQRTEIYEWQIHRIPLPDGRFGVVCYFREISSQVYARRALEAADRQKNEFLAVLAHELRNPLAPIRNSAEVLARTLSQDSQAQVAIGVIKRQVTHATRLVDDLLDVSRISEGRIDLKVQPIDLATVIAQAVETVGSLLREKNHNLLIASNCQPLQVEGDPARLIQCIANILTNAAKYTDPGGQIRLQSRSDGSQVVISISDNGIGISEELMPHLFDLFVQGDRTLDRAQGGLGIGLAVVKRLVEMHGGRVSVASQGMGAGTTFEIRLPCLERAAEPAAKPAQTKALPRRILIVDDDADSANSLSMVLKFDGHYTQTACSAGEALAQMPQFTPDTVLLDIGLPEIDGYEVARRIREIPGGQQVRLIALTGYGQSEDRARAQASGFDGHLVKPVDFAVLERVLSEHQGGQGS